MSTEDARIDGKLVVITGATAGIGKVAAIELAKRGAELALVCRNPTKAAGVVAEITQAVPDAQVRVFRADLSELAQVRAVGAELVAELDRIDVLVNNAGLAARRAEATVEGFDDMLAANYLGPFLLTHLVLDLVRAAAPSRVVIVGSEAHRMAGAFDPETFENMGEYAGPVAAQIAYGRTKLLDLLLSDELARRLAGTGVTVNSLCPGGVATDMMDVGPLGAVTRVLARTPLMNTPEQGAQMTIRLATDPSLDGVTGGFYSTTPGAGLFPTAAPRRDPAIARRVYERTCELVGVEELPAVAITGVTPS